MKKVSQVSHCEECQHEPIDMAYVLTCLAEAIAHRTWFEISTCTAAALAAYIDRLRDPREKQVALEVIADLKDKLRNAHGWLQDAHGVLNARQQQLLGGRRGKQELINREEALRLSDTIKLFHFSSFGGT